MPEGLEYEGLGPLLSARCVDLDRLWMRAEQIGDACMGEDLEVLVFTAQLFGLDCPSLSLHQV